MPMARIMDASIAVSTADAVSPDLTFPIRHFVTKSTGMPEGLNISRNRCESVPAKKNISDGQNRHDNTNPARCSPKSWKSPRWFEPVFPNTSDTFPMTVLKGFVICPKDESGLSMSGNMLPIRHVLTVSTVRDRSACICIQAHADTEAPNMKWQFPFIG